MFTRLALLHILILWAFTHWLSLVLLDSQLSRLLLVHEAIGPPILHLLFLSIPGIFLAPSLVVLNQFSNIEGHPSWFMRPLCSRPHPSSLFLHELHHWHPDLSFTDFISWFLLAMASVGCFLGIWVTSVGFLLPLMAALDWFQWCHGTPCFFHTHSPSHPACLQFHMLQLAHYATILGFLLM